MKKFLSAAAVFTTAALTACANSNIPGETTEKAETVLISETPAAAQSNDKKYENAVSEETTVTNTETTVTYAETTCFDPAEAAELNTDDLLLTAQGVVFNDGKTDNSACYFFCILEDGTVYTMKYTLSDGDNVSENTFTKKLYSCDNSVWDLAENVKAVGNIFSQMNHEMLMENFAAIDWDSGYYERPSDEEVPAVDPKYELTFYLYPMKDGKKTAVFAASDGSYLLDGNASEFLRSVNYSDAYNTWIWQLTHFSRGDYGAEFNVYTDIQELYDAGAEEIYYSKYYPDIVSRIEGNYGTFKIFDSGDALLSLEQIKNFIGCRSAFDEFKHSGGYSFEQLYKGVPVYDGTVILTVDSEGRPDILRSSYVPNIDIDIDPKCSAENIYSTLEEMDAVENYSNTNLCIVIESESLEPVLARSVTVTVKENTWNGAWYMAEIEKLYCFDANSGEFLREYTLSIPN